MSRSNSYHHGDLRQALLAAAREAAAELGVEPLTLREVARRAGVSHAAPYHHFPDKASLLRAMATEAFLELGQALHKAADSKGDARTKLEAIGVAYVRFALAHPAEFRFMFRRDLCPPPTDGLAGDAFQAASQAAYKVLLDGIAACQRAGMNDTANPQMLALSAWSTVHGLAELLLNDPTSNLQKASKKPDELIRAVIRTLHDGLLASQ